MFTAMGAQDGALGAISSTTNLVTPVHINYAGLLRTAAFPRFVLHFGPPPACDDDVDNDGDGLVDYPADPGCTAADARTENPACDNGLDDDGDGLIDLADPGCWGASSGSENPVCNNALDDDGDGLIDLADPQCGNVAWNEHEATSAGCGLGPELVFPLLLLLPRRRHLGDTQVGPSGRL
jgi:hypothetical protein